MRIAASALLFILGGCSGGAGDTVDAGEPVACALDGAADFTRDCTLERSVADGTTWLTIRHPDGGFRRFELPADGSEPVAADGADEAMVSDTAEGTEIAIDDDRYRLPAGWAQSGDAGSN